MDGRFFCLSQLSIKTRIETIMCAGLRDQTWSLSQLSIKTRIETTEREKSCSAPVNSLSQLSIKTRIETDEACHVMMYLNRLSQLSIKTRIETLNRTAHSGGGVAVFESAIH